MKIGIVNQKGGTGKTTLAINLADGLVGRKQQVLLIDADPQQSVMCWQGVRGNTNFRIQPLRNDDLGDLVKDASHRYDHIIIDAPPSVASTTESILSVVNLAIIPIGPSALDVWSSREIISLIRQIMTGRPDLTVKLLVCKTIVGTRLSNEARETLMGFGVELFNTSISQRVAFIEAMIVGMSVLEYAPGSTAAKEIRRLLDEII